MFTPPCSPNSWRKFASDSAGSKFGRIGFSMEDIGSSVVPKRIHDRRRMGGVAAGRSAAKPPSG
jgi:hypothetical protein